jgi:hypothetical protein
VAQLVVIVEILITERDPEHPLADQCRDLVLDQILPPLVVNRDSPDDSRSCVHFCDFPAFSQERVAARTSAVIPDSPNGGSGADLAVFPGIWTHSSYRLLLSA